MLPDEGVTEVDRAEKLERCHVRIRVDIPILREESETLSSILDNEVPKIILGVQRIFQFPKGLEKIDERCVILDAESFQSHFSHRLHR